MGFTAKTLEGLLEIQGNLSTRVINEEYVDYGVFQQAVKLNPTHPLMDEKILLNIVLCMGLIPIIL